MSQLEVVTLIVSLVIGLGMARMLSSLALAIRVRREGGLHWLPLCWAAGIFLLHVQFLIAVYDLDVVVSAWTWTWLGPVLLLSTLLFLAGALILPAQDGRPEHGLLSDFEASGRLALVPVSLYLLVWIPLNVRAFGAAWWDLGNVIDVVLVVAAGVALFTRSRLLRAVASVIWLALVVWGVLFVWGVGGLEFVG